MEGCLLPEPEFATGSVKHVLVSTTTHGSHTKALWTSSRFAPAIDCGQWECDVITSPQQYIITTIYHHHNTSQQQ
jgi:hypothetical protein